MSAHRLLVGILLTLVSVLAFHGTIPSLATLPGLEGVATAALFPHLGFTLPEANTPPTDGEMTETVEPMPSPSPARDAGRPSGKGALTMPPPEFLAQVTPPVPTSTAATIPTTTVPVAEPAAQPAVQPAAQPAPQPAAQPVPAKAPAAPPATPPTGSGVAGFFNYTVQPGDDLPGIAERHDTSPEVIAAESGIGARDTLYAGMSLRVPTTDAARVEAPLRAVAIPWTEVHQMWKPRTVAQVMDVRTGNIFYVMRNGGWAHADAEPVTARDTAIMLENYGGQWSWARRPIVVTINGVRIAASQNGMPHGGAILYNNNFPAHFCIHFLGSTTHGSSYTSSGVPTSDPAHQRAVQEAVGH